MGKFDDVTGQYRLKILMLTPVSGFSIDLSQRYILGKKSFPEFSEGKITADAFMYLLPRLHGKDRSQLIEWLTRYDGSAPKLRVALDVPLPKPSGKGWFSRFAGKKLPPKPSNKRK